MENIDDLIKSSPLSLDETEDVNILSWYYLPYSTGFEVETSLKGGHNKEDFTLINNILEADVNDYGEQRFRIPNGIKGLKCLYEISIALKRNALFNTGSGIHYHIDFSDYYDLLTTEHIEKYSEWILNELDTWNYQGTYNPRKCVFSPSRNWVRFKESTQTMEFRIGEMTFDYELLFKRISHCNDIVRKVKEEFNEQVKAGYREYNINVKEIINNRIIKI